MARRLAAQLDLILKDAAMLAEGDLNLSRSQIETMLRGVVDGHLAKLDRIALAAKSAPGFDPEWARIDDKRAFWTYALLDAQGFAAVVRAEDRDRMTADGLANADIEAVQDHLAMLRRNGLVPTKHHILRQMIDAVGGAPTAMNIDVAQGTYFRAMKLALAEIDRRYGGRRVEDGALYFVPIFIYYTSCRREQLCGAMVDDVVLDNGPIAYSQLPRTSRDGSGTRNLSATSRFIPKC